MYLQQKQQKQQQVTATDAAAVVVAAADVSRIPFVTRLLLLRDAVIVGFSVRLVAMKKNGRDTAATAHEGKLAVMSFVVGALVVSHLRPIRCKTHHVGNTVG